MIAKLPWQSWLALALSVIAAISLPIMSTAPGYGAPVTLSLFGLILVGAATPVLARSAVVEAIVMFVAAHGAAWLLISGITGHEGEATRAFFLLVAAAWLLAWRLATVLSAMKPRSRLCSSKSGEITRRSWALFAP